MKTLPGVSILDYGVGNLGSICNMFRKLAVPVAVATTPAEVDAAQRLILPGVGAFDHGMQALMARGLVDPIRAAADRGTPLLGICLGMQLLAGSSAEGQMSGLGLVNGRCERFIATPENPIRVPHMGWNTVSMARASELFPDDGREWRFYFTHSYHLVGDPADVVGRCVHGVEFTAAIARKNVMGVQFHPEKSHRFGMELLRHFGALPC
jgi:glutamine amidotransferase